MIYLYFALSVVFLLLQLWQQSFLLWKVTLWTSIFSRQLEKESCKNKHCQKHKGPGSWAIKHSAHFCQLLPGVNNLDSLYFCFFFSIIICFNKHVPHWYLHRQMTYHSDWRHTNKMHCICMSTIWMQRRWRQCLHIFAYPSGQLSWLCPRDRKIESRYWLYWHVFPSLSPPVFSLFITVRWSRNWTGLR